MDAGASAGSMRNSSKTMRCNLGGAMLWHGLEIGLMRVGEPFRGVAGDFLGVALHFFTAQSEKKY